MGATMPHVMGSHAFKLCGHVNSDVLLLALVHSLRQQNTRTDGWGNVDPKLSPHADKGITTELGMVMLTDGCSIFSRSSV